MIESFRRRQSGISVMSVLLVLILALFVYVSYEAMQSRQKELQARLLLRQQQNPSTNNVQVDQQSETLVVKNKDAESEQQKAIKDAVAAAMEEQRKKDQAEMRQPVAIAIAPSQQQYPSTTNDSAKRYLAESEREDEIESLHHKIHDLEIENEKLKDKMESEINQMKVDQGYALNNLGGATYMESLSSRMQAAAQASQVEISENSRHISEYKARLSELNAS